MSPALPGERKVGVAEGGRDGGAAVLRDGGAVPRLTDKNSPVIGNQKLSNKISYREITFGKQ